MSERPAGHSRRHFLATGLAATAGSLFLPRFLEASQAGTVVKTTAGPVRGSINSAGVLAFKGIPFADTTGGVNRWKPVGPPKPWTEPRDATKPGPIAPQNDDDKLGITKQYQQSEDCLNLNVWTPAADRARRPVIVFMHGGGFTTGSGAFGLYDGSVLAKGNDVVVVTINYRLGIFGFPPFQIHGPHVSNNLGLLDATQALRWVRANIAFFGGDPDRVLQAGQSAGAMLAATLGIVPAAKGLYQRAAPLSLQYLVTVDRDRQQRYTREILGALGLGPGDLPRLLDVPVAELLAAQSVVRTTGLAAPDPDDQMRWPFMLNHDDVLFSEDPCQTIKRGGYRDVPTMIGSTTEELLISPAQERANPTARARLERDTFLAGLAKQVGGAERAEQIWSVYAAEFPELSEIDRAGLIGTDQLYRMPAIRIAEAQSRHSTAWLYAAGYRGQGPYMHGAHHAIDLPFWFGTLRYPPIDTFFLGHAPTEAELALSERMQAALAGFAANGKAAWPAYDRVRRSTMLFDLESRVMSDPHAATRKIWDGLVV